MRIVYIDPHPVPDFCPESIQILQTVDALAAIGAEVFLVTPQPRKGCLPADILVRPLHSGVRLVYVDDWRNRWWYPSRSGRRFYRVASELVASTSADGLLVRNLKLAEILLSLRKRPPMIFETHEVFARTFVESRSSLGWSGKRKYAALRRREGAVYARCEAIAALTEWLVEDIREEYGALTHAAVIPDGVDLEAAFAVTPKPYWSDPPLLLYLGSLHPWKGVDRLIAALALIPRAKLEIGGGPDARIAQLRQLAADLKVEERISFLGMVPPVQRFQVIAAADICLLPLTDTAIGSRYTSPLKLFEYMAVGKPIVAADVPAIRSVITSGLNGILAPVDDPVRLAKAINDLIADTGRAAALGQAAQYSARDYAWTSRAAKLMNLFTSLGACKCAASSAH